MAKILLVEDDNNLREIYGARLQAEGYEIASAKDGEEALVVAKKEQPDLVIADVMMPRISGFEMLDILRNTEGLRDVKVIMLTALGQAEDKARADQLGADRYLVKSQVTLEDIVKTASDLLGNVPAAATTPAAVEQATAVPAATPAPAAPAPQPAPVEPTVQSVPVATPPPEPPAAEQTPPAAAAPAPQAAAPAPPPPTPPTATPPEPPATNTEELASAVNDLIKSTNPPAASAQPAGTDAPAATPQPTAAPAGDATSAVPTPPVTTPPQTTTDDAATNDSDSDSVTIARKKIIKPLGPEAAPSRPGLHDLLAKEGVDMSQPPQPTPHGLPTTPHPPGHVITPAGGQQQPNSPAAPQTPPTDPNSIAL